MPKTCREAKDMNLIQTFTFLTFFTCQLLSYNSVHGISGSFYADDGRGQSVLYQTLAKQDKIELQKEILQLLGLDHRPKIGPSFKHKEIEYNKSAAEKYLLRLYKALRNAGVRGKFCRRDTACVSLLTESDFIISFANKIDEYTHPQHERVKMFHFDVTNVQTHHELIKAELRIFRNVTNTFRNRVNKKKKYLISLYAVLDDEHNTNTLELVEDLIISGGSSGGWLGFNITTTMMKWIAFPYSNGGLYLKVRALTKSNNQAHDTSLHEAGIYTFNAPNEYKAFMVAYFKTSGEIHLRSRRTPRKKQLNSKNMKSGNNPYSTPQDRYIPKTRSCERWALYISFRDLGFEDWIIAPDGYAAFYCDGSCMFPINAQMNATNHAIVQTLMHLMDPTAVPKPSCAPTQLTSITVLYFDDNSNVILKKYKNMVVKSCGCH